MKKRKKKKTSVKQTSYLLCNENFLFLLPSLPPPPQPLDYCSLLFPMILSARCSTRTFFFSSVESNLLPIRYLSSLICCFLRLCCSCSYPAIIHTLPIMVIRCSDSRRATNNNNDMNIGTIPYHTYIPHVHHMVSCGLHLLLLMMFVVVFSSQQRRRQ